MFWTSTCLVLLQILHLSTSVRVQTSLGDIEGISVNKDGKLVNQFLNIPYAKPPVGNMRFRKPVPVQKWSGVYSATSYGPSCMQIRSPLVNNFIPNKNMSEDCLSLNIYIPGPIVSGAHKSVMIWIHGGGFTSGEAELYDGSNLALTGDVIVVTINYRLGVFGFLSTESSDSLGNYGLWDQLMAIKWVKDNIGNFGGNPKSITIFGESAGAFSTGMLLMAPASDGLFQRVICESGSSLTPSFVRPGVKFVREIGQILNCSLPMSDTLRCIRNVPADILNNITNEHTPRMNFGPVIDGDLITDYPERLLKNRSSKAYQVFSSRDILFGVNNAEGGLYLDFTPKGIILNISAGISFDEFCKFMVSSTINLYYHGDKRILEAACQFYRSNSVEQQARNVVNFYGDLDFVSPMIKTLELHVPSAKSTYEYLFSQQTNLLQTDLPSWYRGANHGDELGFVFGLLDLNPVTKPGDQALANLMMSYWTNFAKQGNPNGMNHNGTGMLPHWPSYTNNKSYMNLSHTPVVENHLFQPRMDFWLKTVPTLQINLNNFLDFIFG